MGNFKCIGLIRTIGCGWLSWRVLWRWLFLGSFLFSSSLYAQDYYWYLNSYAPTPNNFPTPTSACQAMDTSSLTASGWTVTFDHVVQNSPTQYACWYKSSKEGYNGGLPVDRNYTTANRAGTACPADTEYNAATGLCDPVEPSLCEATAGQEVNHQHRIGDFTGTGIIGAPVQPPTIICDNQCQYSFSGSAPSNVYRFVDGSPNGVFGVYSYVGNGVQCTGGESSFSSPVSTTPTSESSSNCTNKVTDAEGRVSYTCTATDTSVDPGNMSCGEANGEMKCYSKSPIPNKSEKDVTTDVTESTNADGSKDTTTTTTTNKTECSGVGSCSTTTTTNTTTSRTNADGSQGPESSTCTGDGCDASSEEEQQEEESLVSGDSFCTAPPACQGDAIQCAILRQTHQQRCQTEEFQKIDAEQLAQQVASDLSGPEFQPLQPTTDSMFDLSSMLDTSSTVGGSCPALPDLTFSVAGYSETFSFGDAMSEFCKWVGWFGYLMVAFAMWRAAEIVAGGFN